MSPSLFLDAVFPLRLSAPRTDLLLSAVTAAPAASTNCKMRIIPFHKTRRQLCSCSAQLQQLEGAEEAAISVQDEYRALLYS